ncbi:ScbA/BarX family gamma-butyrolactone biosynthesis protein [Leifsonia poae]|uniref:ScbA/BarX family gamma-butyrolactone biosynthesis protein n=1 Tax=Leifsonia poae TaxID=110933 RepID=UPI001CBE7EA3|nr:ScbA/BarX family gamma-butyrolactone biosynthesis protein [Leifsonia poae]
MVARNLDRTRVVRFDSTVRRTLVHRAAVAEVFATDVVAAAPDLFECGVQWPRRHSLYSRPDRTVDGALVAETVRQLTILIAHEGYDVSLTDRFLMTGMRYAVTEHRLAPLTAPPELLARVRVDGVRRTGSGRVRTLRANVELSWNGRPVADGRGDATIVDDETYRRLRRGAAPSGFGPPPEPGSRAESEAVGVTTADDVLVSGTESEGGRAIIVDPRHPIYFDHPLDHVPGVLLMDAVRQSARLLLGRPELDFASFDASFGTVVELAPTASVTVTRLGDAASAAAGTAGEIAFEVRQEERAAMTGTAVARPTRAGSAREEF